MINKEPEIPETKENEAQNVEPGMAGSLQGKNVTFTEDDLEQGYTEINREDYTYIPDQIPNSRSF